MSVSALGALLESGQRALMERDKTAGVLALKRAALAYARSLGWLDPTQAAEMDRAMAECDAVHEADTADRERLVRALRAIADNGGVDGRIATEALEGKR